MLIKKIKMFFEDLVNTVYHYTHYFLDEKYYNRCRAHARMSEQLTNDAFNLRKGETNVGGVTIVQFPYDYAKENRR